jgi:hypothetical protein
MREPAPEPEHYETSLVLPPEEGLEPIVWPPGNVEPGPAWWSQLENLAPDLEIERLAAEKVCRSILQECASVRLGRSASILTRSPRFHV